MELVSDKKFIERAKEPAHLEKIRRYLPPDAPEYLYYGAVAKAATEDSDFRRSFFRLPIPDLSQGTGYISDHSDLSYTFSAGLSNVRTVDKAWRAHRRANAGRVLDFGCGSGRLLRFGCEFGEDIELMGCEVNPAAVSWLSSNFPCPVYQQTKRFDLSFLPDRVDMIYAWSIFTHFSEDEHLEWLKSMTDALAPGGLLIATFKPTERIDRLETDPDYRKLSRAENVSIAELRRQATHGFAFFECYDRNQSGGHGIDAATFGQAYISPDYIKRVWGKFGDVVSIETAVKDWQDLVVLQKQ
jgi:SAM-dependent methyltransferase